MMICICFYIRPKKKPGENGGKPKKQKVMKSQAAANAACAVSQDLHGVVL